MHKILAGIMCRTNITKRKYVAIRRSILQYVHEALMLEEKELCTEEDDNMENKRE